MKIAFITRTPCKAKNTPHDADYFMTKALENDGHIIDFICPEPPTWPMILRKFKEIVLRLFSKSYSFRYSLSFAKLYGVTIKKVIKNDTDVIICASNPMSIAFLEKTIPIIYITESSIKQSTYYKKNSKSLLNRSKQEAEEIEKRAVEKASLVFCPSQWTSNFLSDQYDLSPSKICVVPYGPNLEAKPNATKREKSGELKLLLVGLDWEEKGAPAAIQIMNILRQRGINCSLTICGCVPELVIFEEGLTVIPYLDKNDVNDVRELTEVYENASLLILPARSITSGVVVSEASSFSLPSVAPAVEAMTSMIKNNVNGILVSENAQTKEYADAIEKLWNDEKRYAEICASSRKHYEEVLNWNSWAKELLHRIKQLN